MQSKKSVNPVVAIVLILVAVIGIGFVGRMFLAEGGSPQSDNAKWIYAKAQETQGDVNKLNAEDKAKIQKLTGGMGDRALSSAWRVLQKK